MFFVIVSFFVNLATVLLLFLVSIGDLTTAGFFTTFHFLKVTFLNGEGPLGGWLDKPFDVLTLGLWNVCAGKNGVIFACHEAHIDYSLATCVAFLAFLLSLLALWPRFRKRWIHVISAFLSLLVTLACVLLMVMVFTVFVTRKVQFERYITPETDVDLGPGVWITLALVPLTVFGSLFGAFSVCCPGRLGRRRGEQEDNLPESKEEVSEPMA
ncbi:hypothetical protein BGW38_002531 [Lunasporangiospora selenospora]|uniref:Uncharacterized protein n=1 Tax=Lunasporangiospora selenospora TaxID=979761 RepID=A0A9P6KCU1_9FUNG|nr:hypothetical protein BGW38_002531 [Lunasporangiospora selenospora]